MQKRPTSARHLISRVFDERLKFPVGDLEDAEGEPGNRDFDLRSARSRQIVFVVVSPVVAASRFVLGGPFMKVPAGITTISGQVRQSRNLEPSVSDS